MGKDQSAEKHQREGGEGAAEERLELLLIKGLHGKEVAVTDSIWSEIRKDALDQLKLRRASR